MHKGALQKDVLKRALQAYVKVIENRIFVVKGPITHASDFLFPLVFLLTFLKRLWIRVP